MVYNTTWFALSEFHYLVATKHGSQYNLDGLIRELSNGHWPIWCKILQIEQLRCFLSLADLTILSTNSISSNLARATPSGVPSIRIISLLLLSGGIRIDTPVAPFIRATANQENTIEYPLMIRSYGTQQQNYQTVYI